MNYPESYNRFDINNAYYKIYYESCDEFEKVRDLCLEENNWLRANYIKENLKIEDHTGFGVVYNKETDEPMVFGGVFNDGRWPNTVARMLNRAYSFPKFRSKSEQELSVAFKFLHHHLIYPLIELNSYSTYFITMQDRKRPNKNWWKAWKRSFNNGGNNLWIEKEGYIQTCPWMVQKCWQQFIYTEITSGSFNKWNPKILDDIEWKNLPEGS